MRPEDGERGDRVDIRGAKPQRVGIRRGISNFLVERSRRGGRRGGKLGSLITRETKSLH